MCSQARLMAAVRATIRVGSMVMVAVTAVVNRRFHFSPRRSKCLGLFIHINPLK